MSLFREDLLAGRAIAIAPGADGAALERLGARVAVLDRGLEEAAAQVWATEHAPLDGLVCDVRREFGSGGLEAAMQFAWAAVRAVALGALIPGDGGGKIILVGPTPDAAPRAEAARAALENLARTLSVEWARFGITVTAVAPGAATSEAEIAELLCFLTSRAGDYFSGCRFDLGLIRAS